MNNYTYPVLTEEDSAYKENIIFNLSEIRYIFENDKMNISFKCSLTSNYLRELITNGDAYILVTATTLMNKVISKIYTFENEVKLEIPLEKLVDSDNICVQSFVLARNEFWLKYSNEMDDIYSNFKGKRVCLNTQLAISNSLILYYRTVQNSFVSLAKSQELEFKGLRIDYDNSDSILIKAGPAFCDAYAAVSNANPIAKELMNCIIAFLGIYHTSIAIKNNTDILETIQDYEWFDGYNYLFIKAGTTAEEFFESDADDLNDMFEKVQELLGNELEETFIRCRSMLNGSKGVGVNE